MNGNNPCHNCQARRAACHDHCEAYAEYARRKERERQERQKEARLEAWGRRLRR